MALQFYKEKTPRIGDMVTVRITEINTTDGTLKADLLEYCKVSGLVTRVDGRWKTHKAYKQLKEGAVTVLSCNDIAKNGEIDLGYSTVEPETLALINTRYKHYSKIVTFLIKVAAHLLKNPSRNTVELINDPNIRKKTQELIVEVLHTFPEPQDAIDAFFVNTYDMYSKCEKWTFYDTTVKSILMKEFRVPHYQMNIDMHIISLHCDALNHVRQVLQIVGQKIQAQLDAALEQDANAQLTLDDTVHVIAGPAYRLSVHGLKIKEDVMTGIHNDIMTLNDDFLTVKVDKLIAEKKL